MGLVYLVDQHTATSLTTSAFVFQIKIYQGPFLDVIVIHIRHCPSREVCTASTFCIKLLPTVGGIIGGLGKRQRSPYLLFRREHDGLSARLRAFSVRHMPGVYVA